MSLAIGIRYLRGYAVATDATNRDEAEWPPHPARAFMAMAAAHFETGGGPGEREALQWLEAQEAPALMVPRHSERAPVEVYVPPNDYTLPTGNVDAMKPRAVRAALNILPEARRNRQPRRFPTVYVGDEPVYCIWREATPDGDARDALAALCAKVTCLGHSSSLVQMWVADDAPDASLVPDATLAQMRLRCVSSGTLDYLAERFNGEARSRAAALEEKIGLLSAEKKTIKGKGARERKAQIKGKIEELKQDLSMIDARPPLRAAIGLTQGYRRADAPPPETIPNTVFDDRVLVLVKGEGPELGLESTLQLTAALRGAVMVGCVQPPPEWVSGHTQDERPSQSTHLAFVPLGFVGREHADGHVMGLALAFPRQVALEGRGRCLSRLLTDPSTGEPADIELRLGRLGVWTVAREERTRPPSTLQIESWTGPADTWATVTPIALDRFPKADRDKDRTGWLAEVGDIVAASCVNIGLPEPVEIDIDKTSWHVGAPRSRPDHGGFPLMRARPGKPARFQVHAWFRFAQPVRGPVILGAGRYLGYGFCKPWMPRSHQGG